MTTSRKRRSLLLVIPIGFLISTFYVNCSPQVMFSLDYASLSSSGFALSYSMDEDTTLRAKLDVSSILATINATKSAVDFKLLGNLSSGKLVSFSPKTGEFEYKPQANFFGTDFFRFEISVLEDGKTEPLIISQSARIEVLPINDPPVLVQKEVGVASENSLTDFILEATDVDDTNLRYEILGVSNGGQIQAKGGAGFTYYPACGFKGTEQVSVRVSDPSGASAQGIVTLRVTADNGTITLSRTLAQDTTLNDSLLTLSNRCVASGSSSSLSVAANPARGSISAINSTALSYSYTPNSGFYGNDSATFLLRNGSYQKNVVINYVVTHVNKLPVLTKTAYETYQNSSLNITLQISDPDDSVVYSYLSQNKENKITTGLGGSLEKQSSGVNDYLYIAPRGLRDVSDQFVVYLVDQSGQFVPFTVRVSILANPIVTLKPGLAARGLSCTVCHAQINANVITDFGHGSSFAQNVGNNWSDDPYGNREATVADRRFPITQTQAEVLDTIKVWESGKILQTTHVPNAVSPNFGQTYAAHLQSLRPKTYGLVTFPFGDTGDLLSGALAGSSVAAAGSFGPVTAYNEVYIGAPTAAEITNRMLDKSQAYEVQGSLQGLSWRSGNSKQYMTNVISTVNCEGDVIVKGAVLLNSATILTTSGCRIYATGPIFTQGPLNIYAANGDNSRSNLQLSSAVAVMMGVGMEAITTRQSYALPTRGDTGGRNVMATVASEAANLGSVLQDAMRHSSRQVSFSRLLLNAPQVHSRYNSVFRGTIIAEIAVMSPGEFVYYFDDVFLNPSVEILPLLAGPSILKVK